MTEWWTDEGAEESKQLLLRENANGVPIERFAGTRTQVTDRWGDTWIGTFGIVSPGLYMIALDDEDPRKSADLIRLHDDSLADFRWPSSGLATDYYQFARETQLRAHA